MVNNCIPQKKKCLYQLRKMCLKRILFSIRESAAAYLGLKINEKNRGENRDGERGIQTDAVVEFHHVRLLFFIGSLRIFLA